MSFALAVGFALSIAFMLFAINAIYLLYTCHWPIPLDFRKRGRWQNITSLQVHNSLVEKGRKLVQTRRICVIMLARNIAGHLDALKRNLTTYLKDFTDYAIVVFENDSTDGTRSLLKDWSNSNPRVYLIECPVNDCKFKHLEGYDYGAFSEERLSKMASHRERCLVYARANFGHFDYVLVLDSDLGSLPSYDGLLQTIARENEWDAVAVNGRQPFGWLNLQSIAYDSLAFVDVNGSLTKPIPVELLPSNLIEMNDLINRPTPDPLVPVKCAFNGACLYKTDALREATYLYGSDNRMCEHIRLAASMHHCGKSRYYLNRDWFGLFNRQGPQTTYHAINSLLK